MNYIGMGGKGASGWVSRRTALSKALREDGATVLSEANRRTSVALW